MDNSTKKTEPRSKHVLKKSIKQGGDLKAVGDEVSLTKSQSERLKISDII